MRGFIVLLVLMAALMGCTGERYVATPEGKAMYEEKCSLCHSLERSASKRMTYDGWRSTVVRMREQNGAVLTNEQVAVIAEYLTATHGK